MSFRIVITLFILNDFFYNFRNIREKQIENAIKFCLKGRGGFSKFHVDSHRPIVLRITCASFQN